MSSDFPHYSFRMPNIGFQNLPLNIYIVVFGTAIFVFILSLLFCCYLIRCLIKWLEVRKVCPLCNMPVLQLAQQAGSTEPPVPIQQPLPGIENLV
ncbi:RING finger protein 24 [Nibea albiflora]|uniref:RING finger protein 24 n=1 Tax=Nibea albiflora TaxID=240163 RepID=A0ACB7FK04_NIBAL|nr:RING finger protein 24 [Nibea albiflora]